MSQIDTRSGDTIIEATIAITIFSLVAVLNIMIMNSGIARAQYSLELTMARNEIDAQAESLRFIHNSFLAERDFASQNQEYAKLWQAIRKTTNTTPPLSQDTCEKAIKSAKEAKNVFIVNTRVLNDKPQDTYLEETNRIISLKDNNIFTPAPVYPRIIYSNIVNASADSREDSEHQLVENNANDASAEMPSPYNQISRVEGIWIQGVAQKTENNNPPEYYDFHIRTCWNPAGKSDKNPSTIGTILRLYNPEYAEKGKDI